MNLFSEKYQVLLESLRSLQRVAVAFSGGVDSTFLLMAARAALGDQAVAYVCRHAAFQHAEADFAAAFCQQEAIPLTVLDVPVLELEAFCSNPPDRCYHCKKALFQQIQTHAASCGVSCVLEGSNADDVNDYRPGMRALAELGILSPLKASGFTKDEIRSLSQKLGLPTWQKPSLACLATRIPYGDQLTQQKLRRIEQAETFLTALGFSPVRVRLHGTIARIEVLPCAFSALIAQHAQITEHLVQMGFSYVTLDLLGFRSGSMNEILHPGPEGLEQIN